MFDFGFGELLVIGIVALIVIGPKDLPGVFRELGRFTGKVRRMAREFSRAMEDAADEAGVKDAAKTFRDATNPSKMGLNKLSEAADKFEKWDPTKPSKKAADAGPETAKLSEERAEAARKIREYSAEKANERIAAEKAAEEAGLAADAGAPEPETKGEA
ncbi:MAG: Sec-independent protein translocase protein TatB [Silicimonas sp.]|jgi:sec-independent protein translocase protein TatB|nr:Sec-independent protein translocase protein TatB [Silicimonas sp.]